MDRIRTGGRPVLALAILALAAAAGCERPVEQGERGAPAGSANANGAAEAIVELKPIDKAGFDKLLAESDAPVVLVDYWGYWCPACMQKFPHTVEFHEKYAGRGLKVVSLAIEDKPDETRDAALEFLTKQGATFANYIADAKYEDLEAASKAFDVGPFPTYRLFRKGGALIANFELGEGHEEIEAAIKKALDEQPAAGHE
ncbi:MAG: thioredoxin domain-containing protein [Planctomycetales bacterium]